MHSCAHAVIYTKEGKREKGEGEDREREEMRETGTERQSKKRSYRLRLKNNTVMIQMLYVKIVPVLLYKAPLYIYLFGSHQKPWSYVRRWGLFGSLALGTVNIQRQPDFLKDNRSQGRGAGVSTGSWWRQREWPQESTESRWTWALVFSIGIQWRFPIVFP